MQRVKFLPKRQAWFYSDKSQSHIGCDHSAISKLTLISTRHRGYSKVPEVCSQYGTSLQISHQPILIEVLILDVINLGLASNWFVPFCNIVASLSSTRSPISKGPVANQLGTSCWPTYAILLTGLRPLKEWTWSVCLQLVWDWFANGPLPFASQLFLVAREAPMRSLTNSNQLPTSCSLVEAYSKLCNLYEC